MKNILIISDTHGNIKNLDEIISENSIDYIIHLGDNFEDYDKIVNKFPNIETYYIFGNHDLEWLEPKECIFEINGVRIYAAHGHMFNVKLGFDEIIKEAKKNNASIALFGHSHIQKCVYKDGIIIINPGSLSESRDKNILGSYAILQVGNNKINVINRWIEHEEILGVEINTVKLNEYNPLYKELFLKEKEILKKLVGNYIIDIQHIGSTSMPGICSKPIIDIVIAINDLKDIDKIKKILVEEGYIYKGPIACENDRYQFLKGNSFKRDYHIYFTTLHSDVWDRFVLYRDYMLTHKDALKKYEAIKKQGARLYPNDRAKYLEHKQGYIDKINEIAKAEYYNKK